MFSLEISYNLRRFSREKFHLMEKRLKCFELVLSITLGNNLSCSKLPISIKEQRAPVSSRALMCLFSMQMDITEENNLELSLVVFSLPSSHLYLVQVEFHA